MIHFARPIFDLLRAGGARYWLLFDALRLVCRDPEQALQADTVTDIGVDETDFAPYRERILGAPPFPGEGAQGRWSGPDSVSVTLTGRRVVLWRTARRGIARAVASHPERTAYEFHFSGAEGVAIGGVPVAVPRYAPRLLDHWYGPGWRRSDSGGPLASNPAPLRPVLRVLVDGVFDLFHVGHVRLLAKARDLYGHVTVGVVDDDTAASYKRRPVIPHAHRAEVVRACRFVDQVIPSYPMRTTASDLDALGIDFLVHGACDPASLRTYYSQLMVADRLHTLPEFDGYHTTDLIARAGTAPPGPGPGG